MRTVVSGGRQIVVNVALRVRSGARTGTRLGTRPGSFAGPLAGALALGLAFAAVIVASGCSPISFGGGAGGSTARETATAGQTAPTSAIQERLARAVYLNIWGLGVQKIDTVYDPQHATARVTITLGGTTPNTPVKARAADELTKAFCLMAHQALWASGTHLDEATVTVQGPLQDEYADTIIDAYGVATVEAQTAQRISWANVSADDAWQAYDHVFLREGFELVD